MILRSASFTVTCILAVAFSLPLATPRVSNGKGNDKNWEMTRSLLILPAGETESNAKDFVYAMEDYNDNKKFRWAEMLRKEMTDEADDEMGEKDKSMQTNSLLDDIIQEEKDYNSKTETVDESEEKVVEDADQTRDKEEMDDGSNDNNNEFGSVAVKNGFNSEDSPTTKPVDSLAFRIQNAIESVKKIFVNNPFFSHIVQQAAEEINADVEHEVDKEEEVEEGEQLEEEKEVEEEKEEDEEEVCVEEVDVEEAEVEKVDETEEEEEERVEEAEEEAHVEQEEKEEDEEKEEEEHIYNYVSQQATVWKEMLELVKLIVKRSI